MKNNNLNKIVIKNQMIIMIVNKVINNQNNRVKIMMMKLQIHKQ